MNPTFWSDGRAVEGGGLENRCAERYRGFESPLLRGLKGSFWSGDREAEGGSLLRSYTPKGYRGFESPLLRTEKVNETIAQLDRASDCGSEGRQFEPA